MSVPMSHVSYRTVYGAGQTCYDGQLSHSHQCPICLEQLDLLIRELEPLEVTIGPAESNIHVEPRKHVHATLVALIRNPEYMKGRAALPRGWAA